MHCIFYYRSACLDAEGNLAAAIPIVIGSQLPTADCQLQTELTLPDDNFSQYVSLHPLYKTILL